MTCISSYTKTHACQSIYLKYSHSLLQEIIIKAFLRTDCIYKNTHSEVKIRDFRKRTTFVLMCKLKSFSRVWLSETPRTIARQTPLPMEFSRPEYWSGKLFPSPGDCPNPGIEHRSPILRADSLSSEPPGKHQTVLLQNQNSSRILQSAEIPFHFLWDCHYFR